MRAYYCDHFVLPLPEGHRFPMEKYRLLRERVDGELPAIQLCVPLAASEEELGRVHTADYVASVLEGHLTPAQIRKIGFPWSAQLVERSRRSVGGTIAAARSALVSGASANLAGGTHHAFPDRGEGFCVFNDVAVSVAAMKAEGCIERAAIIDLDVHQGNGTAAICENDFSTFTVSVHGAGNFPFNKGESDLDIALPDGAEDGAYLAATDRALDAALSHRPDVVYFVAGADPYQGDRLGRLAVTKAGLASRDRAVVEACRTDEIPLVVVMSGGYAAEVADTVDIHFSSIRTLVQAALAPA